MAQVQWRETQHAAASRVEAWLRDAAFPFWADRGVDPHGPGFAEHLTLDGMPADVPFKRLRVQARQIYCFCQAAELGLRPDALAIAERGVDLLIHAAWQGVERGWVSTLTRSGEPLQTRPDLYDTAFALFALGWWHKMTGDPRVPVLGHQTLDFLATRMAHPSGRGYAEWQHAGAPHLQNPHMHLTEAMIVLRDSTGDSRFAEEADRLVRLCLDDFYDPGSGTLAEEFDASWQRDRISAETRIEPGHHYEWVWLLHRYLGADRDDPEIGSAMRGLFDFVQRHGQSDRTSLVFDAVLADGTPALPDHRLWPQTERLKAWLAMGDRFGIDAQQAVETGVASIFRHYLDTQPHGTWIEHRTATLAPRIDKIPTSSFYHLVLAFSEILRHQRHSAGHSA